MGPLGKSEGLNEQGLKFKIKAVSKIVPYIKLVHSEKLRVADRTEEAYIKFYPSEEFNKLFKELIIDKSDLRIGFNKIFWDGRDNDGDIIANGTYLYKVYFTHEGRNYSEIKKLVKME